MKRLYLNGLSKGQKSIARLIGKHRIPSKLCSHYVNPKNTYGWDGLFTKELEDDLKRLDYPYSISIADVKSHEDFGKKVIEFTTFGIPMIVFE